MLIELNIDNIAVIEHAKVNFCPGFNVLTGETGAGKSIIIDAVGALLGNRLAKDLIRTGTPKASICAVFDHLSPKVMATLESLGFPTEDEQLIIVREISADGKSSVRINGRPALVSMLKELVPQLIAIHGQQDNASLISPDTHLYLLDRYGDICGKVDEYKVVYKELCSLIKQRDALLKDEQEKAQRADFLTYQIEEIRIADFKSKEPEMLTERKKTLQNVELLSGDWGAITQIRETMSLLGGIAPIADEYDDKYEVANGVFYEMQELSTDLAAMLENIQAEPGELAIIEERLEEFYRLRQKYGNTLEEIELYCEKAEAELKDIENGDAILDELYAKIEVLGEKAKAMCKEITKKRKKSFETLQKDIINSLDFLNMSGIHFELKCEPKAMSRDGADVIEFLIATNPGEPTRPLGKIASGGELARIMLALKNSLSDADETPTVIYDEIDTGVSGSAAFKIGKMMNNTASSKQVFAVTHSAQIAACAHNHIYIEKTSSGDRAKTLVNTLDETQRKNELARIISGDNVTDTALANAAEMLELAHK